MLLTAISSPEELTVELLSRQYPRAAGSLLRASMVTSIDGMTSVAGRSGPLSGGSDRRIFHFLRAGASAVIVGARTVLAEGYRKDPSFTGDLAEYRSRCGLPETLRIVVASRGGTDPEPLAGFDRIVLRPDTTRSSLLERLELEDPAVVLCEGGPSLLHRLTQSRAVDEYCVTLAFTLVGAGDTPLSPESLLAPYPLAAASAIVTAEAAHLRLVPRST